MSSLLGKVFEVGEATRVVDAAIQVYLACSFTSVRCRGYVGEYTAVAFERQLAIIFGCWDNVCASTRRWSLARERTSCPGSKYCLRINTSKKERSPREYRASAVGQLTVGGTDSAPDQSLEVDDWVQAMPLPASLRRGWQKRRLYSGRTTRRNGLSVNALRCGDDRPAGVEGKAP